VPPSTSVAAKPAPTLLDRIIPPAYADDAPPTHTPTLYLQIGAFANRDNAEQLRSKLSAAHVPGIHISETLSNQRPLYRVRVGPLASAAEADRMASELVRYGITNPRVAID
jgi:rare lipoprotein A